MVTQSLAMKVGEGRLIALLLLLNRVLSGVLVVSVLVTSCKSVLMREDVLKREVSIQLVGFVPDLAGL